MMMLLLSALLRQTNVHWEAYFFITDEAPYEEELLHLLEGYKDHRLMYIPIAMKHRPKVSS